jgi:nucleotide-binding universal stress UspA family protein
MAYAISLAREHKAELVFFHVTQFPWRTLACSCPLDMLAVEEWRSQVTVEHLLRIAASRIENFVQPKFGAKILGVSWTIRTSIGKVPREIVVAAVQEEADCIVMARRKRGILLRFLEPSVSTAVSANAPCPVMSLCPPHMEHLSSDRGRGVMRQLRTLHEF